MNKTKVKSILAKYRKNMDWLSLYEETSSVGASFVSGNSGDGMITGSQPENDVVRRQDKRQEYEERKKYNKMIEKVLDKLPADERLVINYQYNLVNDEYLNQYDILGIPIAEMLAYLPFERRTYYAKEDNAYNILCELFSAIF